MDIASFWGMLAGRMNKTDILSALDEEISRLRQARDLLADASLPMRGTTLAKVASSAASEPVAKRGPGRPKGSGSKAVVAPAPEKKKPGRPTGTSSSKSASSEAKESTPKRRTMSAEGKARIAAAQRARWARQHGETATKGVAGKKSASKTVANKAAKKSAPVKAASTKTAPKAAKTVKKAPVKARGPYKKTGVKASAKPAAEMTAQSAAAPASE